MAEFRTKNSFKNLIVGISMQVFCLISAFVCRTIFAQLLSKEYLGIGGLFTNIISVLSLSELGIGSAIIVNLYKPLAEGDDERVACLMNFYRTVYTCIGLFVMVCGLVLTPFLRYLVKNDADIPNLSVYFLMFILQSASSYFFSYKQSLLVASQKEYICSLVRQAFNLLMNILQIAILLLTGNYLLYLTISVITSLGNNLTISLIADKKYPFIKTLHKAKLEKAEKKSLFKNVGSMMLHKVGNTLISSTDNILISSMIGIIITGLYSNYVLIINMIAVFANMVINALSAGIGDFVARKSRQDVLALYKSLCRLNIWIFGMCAICFCCLFQPTIGIWLGSSFLLDYKVVLLVSVNFYVGGLLKVPGSFIDVTGLYNKTKWKPIIMALANLVSSIVFAQLFGLIGIFMGTIICYLIGIWVDPLYLYKDYFREPPNKYYLFIGVDTLIIAAIGVACYLVAQMIPYYILKVIVCGVFSNALILLYYRKTKEFAYIYQRVYGLLCRKHNKETL